VGTRNKEHVGKHRIVPYCESIFTIKLKLGNMPLLPVFALL